MYTRDDDMLTHNVDINKTEYADVYDIPFLYSCIICSFPIKYMLENIPDFLLMGILFRPFIFIALKHFGFPISQF